MYTTPFYQRKWFYFTLPIVLLSGFYLVTLFKSGISKIGVDLIVFVGLLFVWLGFYAQFTLPVRNSQQRLYVLIRLIYYVLRQHGPAIFIKNGKVIENAADEKNKEKPGVIWLDTASAAVLRTDAKFTRTVGPGVVFTAKGEYIAGSVDLRRQSQSIGPLNFDKPFDAPSQETPPEIHAAVQERRQSTSGLTRDGIEVVPNIGMIFSIDAQTNAVDPKADSAFNTQYGYSEESVRNAIRGEGVVPDEPEDTPSHRLAWNEIPVHLAVDLWREYLRKFTFSQLFMIGEGEEGESGLEIIVRMMNERLKSKWVDGLSDVGAPIGGKVLSPEFKQLTERGLKVAGVSVRTLFIAPNLEDDIIQGWSTSWLAHAQKESQDIDTLGKMIESRGYEDALMEFAETASQFLGDEKKTPDPVKALGLLVQGTNYNTARNNKIRRHMNTETRDIQEILKWIMERR
jgi:hypothetical protein